ncbi:MAG: GxxExxY protein [bacterium]|jgi:GxxExxY protein
MPIETAVPIRPASRQEFYDMDFEMMRHALDIHSDYGGVLDEAIYKNELTLRCNKAGLSMEREVLVRVKHGEFTKDYRIDLLMKRCVIVEGKTAERIVSAHRGQTANYLMLANIRFGSLINFQGPSAKREFVTSLQDLEERRRFELFTARWPRDEQHAKLKDIAVAFCRDIGLSLDAPLYRAAFTFLLGGMTANPVKVPVYSGDIILGHHLMHLLTPERGLAVTCLEKPVPMRTTLHKLLKHTHLKVISWINLKHHEIQFQEVQRQG